MIEDHTSRAAVTRDRRRMGGTPYIEYGRQGSGKWEATSYVRTLLPVRWDIVVDGVPTNIALSFVHDPSFALRPPKGVKAPRCVNQCVK